MHVMLKTLLCSLFRACLYWPNREAAWLVTQIALCSSLVMGKVFYFFAKIITQYGSTVYLGTTQVVLGQFQHFKNTRCGITAKRSHKEQKEHYSLTK